MPKYRVVIEAPALQETYEFEAETTEEAESIGRDIFFDICNYGVSPVHEGES